MDRSGAVEMCAPPPPTLPPEAAPDGNGAAVPAIAAAAAAAAMAKPKKRGVHKLIKAFKRGDPWSAKVTAADGGSVEGGSIGGLRGGARKGKSYSGSEDSGSFDGDRSDRSSFEFDAANPKLLAQLRNAKIGHANEPFAWEKKMRDLLQVPSSSCFLSLLLLPKASDPSSSRYNCLEDTLARADAWLLSAQASGIPVVFMNIQTEALLTKISGEAAMSTVNMGSLADLANMANVSLYGFEDYHGVDIGVVRAVRLWYTPVAGEMALEIKLLKGDTRLGFAISRTEEGFIYVSSVADESTPAVASTRSGLLELYREARKASKLLVISRVGHEKVLPWMVSTAGDIKCYDTVSLSQKLSLHRHALRPITLHFLMWEEIPLSTIMRRVEASKMQNAMVPLPPQLASKETEAAATSLAPLQALNQKSPIEFNMIDDEQVDCSFRFQDIKLPDSWV